ncbi:hypothetical protein OAE21_00730 [Rubripirellula sp.]|nr:hypothetical protein [Rubripirellula sp.]
MDDSWSSSRENTMIVLKADAVGAEVGESRGAVVMSAFAGPVQPARCSGLYGKADAWPNENVTPPSI